LNKPDIGSVSAINTRQLSRLVFHRTRQQKRNQNTTLVKAERKTISPLAFQLAVLNFTSRCRWHIFTAGDRL